MDVAVGNAPTGSGYSRARDELLELTRSADLRPYRGERALKKIPEPERGEWRAFWVELRLLLGRSS